MRIPHLINGQAVAGREHFNSINPANQQLLAEVAAGSAEEVQLAVAAAKSAFPAWAATPPAQRARIMHRLGELITRDQAELARIETADCGQAIAQTGANLVPRAADSGAEAGGGQRGAGGGAGGVGGSVLPCGLISIMPLISRASQSSVMPPSTSPNACIADARPSTAPPAPPMRPTSNSPRDW